MPINRYFKLYLNAGRSIPLVIGANQNDKDEQWYFSLFTETGEQYFPDAGAIVGIKCDGKLIDNEATVDSRGYVIVTETAQMTAVPGKNIFELQLNEHTHGTANFIVLVEPSPTNGGVLSDSDLSLFQQAINSIAIAGSGAPAVATLASEMIDTGKIYLYAGSETGYTAGHWYYYKGSAWVDGGKYGGTVDSTLTVQGAAADAKAVGDEISDLKSQIDQKSGLTEDVKQALLACFRNISFIADNGCYETLEEALYPPVDLVRITAVYTQSGTVYDTDSLDSLKENLVVTAYYDNGTSEIISGYTLSGTLTEGPTTITATYGGKSATFTVEVTHASALVRISNQSFDGSQESTVTSYGITNNMDFSIVADFSVSETLNNKYLISALTSDYKGPRIEFGTNGKVNLWGNNKVLNDAFTPVNNERIRILYLHTGGDINALVAYMNYSDSVPIIKRIGDGVYTGEGTLRVVGAGFKGTVNELAFYDKVIGYSDIRTLFGLSSTSLLLEIGSFAAADGSYSESTTRARTATFIPDNVNTITCESGYSALLYAWEGSTFKGFWCNNDNFGTSGSTFLASINLSAMRERFPTYKFKILFRNETTPSATITLAEAYENIMFE